MIPLFGRYIHTKLQLADLLTKGTFTVEAWSFLCGLFRLGPPPAQKKVKGPGGVAMACSAKIVDITRVRLAADVEDAGGKKLDVFKDTGMPQSGGISRHF